MVMYRLQHRINRNIFLGAVGSENQDLIFGAAVVILELGIQHLKKTTSGRQPASFT